MSEAITISNEKVESKNFTYDDLQIYIKKGGKGIPVNKPYDPKVFWDSMGDKFYKAFDKPEKCGFGVEFFIDRLKQLQPIDSLLDVGCGFGRLAPFLLQAQVCKQYTGIDIAESIVKCSENYLDISVKEENELEKVQQFFMNGNISDDTKTLIAKDVNSLLEVIKKKQDERAKKQTVDYRDKIKLSQGDSRKIQFDSNSFDCVIVNEVLQNMNYQDAIESCREIARVSKSNIVLLERWAFPNEHSEPHVWSHNYSQIFTELGLDVLQTTTISQGLQGLVVRKR